MKFEGKNKRIKSLFSGDLEGQVFKGSEFFEKKAMEKTITICDLLDGELIKSDSGEFFLKRTVIYFSAIDSPSLEPILAQHHFLNSQTLSIIGRDSDIESINPKKLLYLDTETTGLAGGTGTYAFLVGCGYFQDDSFIIEQFFMGDYHFETAMLVALKSLLSRFEGFVTYNGKCYDIPLLRSRFIYNRIPINLEIPNLDLLFIARRFWKRRLGDCSLQNIESNILNVKRENDIPSELIPYVYFDYVRGIRRERMVNVFNHNQQDIFSLALMTILAHNIYENPYQFDLLEPIDLYGLALTYQKDNFCDKAIECYLQTLDKLGTDSSAAKLPVRSAHFSGYKLFPLKQGLQTEFSTTELEFHIRNKLSMLYKKMCDYENAVNIWFDLVDRFDVDDIFHFEELAKYFEHRARDYDTAISIVQRAIQKIEMLCELHSENTLKQNKYNESLQLLKKRLSRLKKKQGNG